jgi:arylsulfatase
MGFATTKLTMPILPKILFFLGLQVMERTLLFILQWYKNFDIGADTGTPVDDPDYPIPFRFNGKLDQLTLTINRPQLTPADKQKLLEAQRNNRVSE